MTWRTEEGPAPALIQRRQIYARCVLVVHPLPRST